MTCQPERSKSIQCPQVHVVLTYEFKIRVVEALVGEQLMEESNDLAGVVAVRASQIHVSKV